MCIRRRKRFQNSAQQNKGQQYYSQYEGQYSDQQQGQYKGQYQIKEQWNGNGAQRTDRNDRRGHSEKRTRTRLRLGLAIVLCIVFAAGVLIGAILMNQSGEHEDSTQGAGAIRYTHVVTAKPTKKPTPTPTRKPTPTPTRRPTPTPLVYQPGCRYNLSYTPKTGRAASSGSNLYVERTYESSHLSNKYGDYRSSNAFDDNRGTDWVEGSAGYRLGDYVGCSWRVYGGYSTQIAAYGFAIRGGMQYKGSESWGRNERPRSITVNVNGYNYSFTMSDTMSEQTFYFNGDAIMPDSSGRFNFRLTINSCYELPGDHYDIAVNDIDLICAHLK